MGGAALIIEILTAIGIRTAGIEAVLAIITRIGGLPILRTAFVRKKLLAWALSIYSLADTAHWLYESVCKFLSKLLNETIDSLDVDAILHAGGRAFAKTFRKKLLEKYGIDCPISDWASETIAEEVGEWFADMINQKIQELAHTDQVVFSTMFPVNNIVPELDAFLVEELSVKLNINVTSVLQNSTLIDDIKHQILEKLTEQFYVGVGQLQVEAMAQVKQHFNNSQLSGYRDAINAIDNVAPLLVSHIQDNLAKQIPILSKVKFTPNQKKINNKLRQREYRRTHKEVRHWELR